MTALASARRNRWHGASRRLGIGEERHRASGHDHVAHHRLDVRSGQQPVIDILLTHAHDDHMGGLIHKGALTFPNATVHVGKADVEFFKDRSNAAKAHYGLNYFDDYFDEETRRALFPQNSVAQT